MNATATLPRLILASASPRRLDLLRQIGIEQVVIDAAEIDERPLNNELPAAHAARLALAKARAVAARHGDGFVLAADTVVGCGRRILPKAETEAEAARCLALLSGRRHRVLGGICVIAPGGKTVQRLVTSIVRFKRLTAPEIASYIESGEWRGKAGGYAIQGRAGAFAIHLTGSYSNIVGLPLYEAQAMLRGLGWPA